MDTMRVIKSKIAVLSPIVPDNRGISAVLRHIEVAESHLSNGQSKQDRDLFTDVIYRCNHAFEGILKEAYALLAKQDPDRKTPHEIEEYLAGEKVFRDPVVALFTQYRRDWRNPSTHQYQLTYSEQEAFLALMSVSSFVCVLLDQMIEAAAYDRERASAPDLEIPESPTVEMELMDKVAQLLLPGFSRSLMSGDHPVQSSQEIHGMLSAYIGVIAPDIAIEEEPTLRDKYGAFRPDFLLTRKNEHAVIEVIAYRSIPPRIKDRRRQQMIRALDAAGAKSGIFYKVPLAKQWKTIRDLIVAEPIDGERYLIEVTPKPVPKPGDS